jgi:ribonuclease HII
MAQKIQTKKTFVPTLENEKKLWKQGYRFVVGLDEVGRGPLAGPVVACAVCIKSKADPNGFKKIRDSKKLNAAQREKWYAILTKSPDIKWGIGIVSPKIIDKKNIFQATKLAMRLALKNLKVSPNFLLLDGNFLLDGFLVSQKAVPKGDTKIVSCAAASVIAKVTRDRMMVRYHEQYPKYGFNEHKGYGCKKHFQALQKYGPTPIHRKSFNPVRMAKDK